MSAQLKAQVDKLLTNASSAYIPKDFVCEQVLPSIQVAQYSGLLGKWGTSHLRIENAVKGGRGKYRRVESQARSSTTFLVQGHGLSGMVTKEDYANVEQPFDAERDEVIGLTTMLFLEKEKLLADTLTSTSILTQNTTLSGTTQFSDYNNSDPLAKFSTARVAINDGCGVQPNLAIVPWKVWDKVRYHPQLLDALGFKYDRPGGLKEAELASIMGVEKVLIPNAYYESAKEGQTSSLASVWGKHIVFAVAPSKAEVMQVSLGYMIRMVGGQPRKVYRQSLFNPPGATELLCEDEYDMLVSKVEAGYLMKDVIA